MSITALPAYRQDVQDAFQALQEAIAKLNETVNALDHRYEQELAGTATPSQVSEEPKDEESA